MMKKYALLFLFSFMIGTAMLSAQSDPNNDQLSEVKDNFALNSAVNMYPNPVEQFLTVRSNSTITRVQVYSLLGDLVKDVRSNFLRIDMRNLNSGIYMIKIYSNEFFTTKKLIKK